MSVFFIKKLRFFTKNTPETKQWFFSDAAEVWLKKSEVTVKRSTLSRYHFLISKQILPTLGDTPLNDISYITLQAFMNDKLVKGRLDESGGLSPAYVKSIMTVVEEIMKTAVEEEMCLPIIKNIKKPQIRQRQPAVLSAAQQKKYESRLVVDLSPSKFGIILALEAGMRIGEICALKWEHIDFADKVIHISSTVIRTYETSADGKKLIYTTDSPKTVSSIRDIPISEKLYGLFLKIRSVSTSEYVISDSSSFVNPRTLENRFKRTLEADGITDITFHTLRHTFATRCIEAGMDVKTLSEIMGHSNVSITLNTYVHSSLERKRTEIEKLNILP